MTKQNDAPKRPARKSRLRERIKAKKEQVELVVAAPERDETAVKTAAVSPAYERGTLVIIDDELEILKSLQRQFRKKYNVHVFTDASKAYEFMCNEEAHVILSDQRMPEMTGAEFFHKVKGSYPDSIRLLLTGYADIDAVITAINDGNVFRYITKPWNPEELEEIIDESFRKHVLEIKNKQLLFDLKGVNSELARRVEEQQQELEEMNKKLHAMTARLSQLSYMDELTGLLNRREFEEKFLDQIVACTERKLPLSLLMLDLDHFKNVNDVYGHDIGDIVLEKMGDLLRDNLRLYDLPCRYGGEEFCVLLVGVKATEAQLTADRFRVDVEKRLTAHFAQAFKTQNPELPERAITVSIGVASMPEHCKLADYGTAKPLMEQLHKLADLALYQAKEQGRNQTIIYGASPQVDAAEDGDVE